MSDDKRGTTIVFNGMIYNFVELRRRLEAHGETFRSDCDTEVVLKAFGYYGRGCVGKLRGMFAFAIWDSRNHELFLARDRLGIKPLYYFLDGDRFVFASQVKALLASGLMSRRLSPDGLATYLGFGAVSDPLTIVDGVHALPAGHTGSFRDGELRLNRYWDPPSAMEANPSLGEVVAELRAMLDEIVRGHLVSDAPLGVFLSGGLDSSALAAVSARHTDRLKTISVVFDERAYSEEAYIDSVTQKLGVDHVSVKLGSAKLRDQLSDAFNAMDQPSFDGINTFVVSKAAHDAGLKVALSGLGADELFDGYGYVSRVATLERMRSLPRPLPQLGAATARLLGDSSKSVKLRHWLSGEAIEGSSYELLRRLFLQNEVRSIMFERDRSNGLPRPLSLNPGHDLFGQLSMLDLTNYTKNVLLRDTDAMSMANSVEVRVPYLDHQLVEWILRLPASVKTGRSKALLIAALRDRLPEQVLTRKKHGFLLPLKGWMTGDLHSDVADTLSDLPSQLGELLDPQAVQNVWTQFSSTGDGWLRPWSLYALCKWTESLVERPAVTARR